MSCLWSWCCRVREDPDTDSESKEEKQNKKRKEGKKKKSWKTEWKKDRKNKKKEGEEGDEETTQPDQRPGKVEVEADALDLPVGLKSSSHKNVSAEALKITAPPLRENVAEEADESIKSITKTLLVKAQMEQLLAEMDVKKRDLPEEEAESRKRKNRRGTRGKGRKIKYNKDKDPPNHKQDDVKNDSTVCGHRGRAQGLRGQHLQDKRKTPPETPRPTTDFHQHMTHDRRQISH
ncbi:hypothetical protein MHYP_G00109570 [Metynnis hypsauchen]